MPRVMNRAVTDRGIAAGPNTADGVVHGLDRRKECGIAVFDSVVATDRFEIPELKLHIVRHVIDDTLGVQRVNGCVERGDQRRVFGCDLG